MLTKEKVEENLRKVLDPELGINIVDLGLIYDIKVQKNSVYVLMTLTFPGCPLGATIHKDIKKALAEIENIGEVKLEVTFDPPWNLNKISSEARAELGMN